VRIPNHQFCKELIKEFGKPIVSTSANKSGEDTPKSFDEINQEIVDGVDYVVSIERDKVSDKSSTILKLIGDEVQVIRP
jgi:L-threonylcarbamoyladenylate synthase